MATLLDVVASRSGHALLLRKLVNGVIRLVCPKPSGLVIDQFPLLVRVGGRTCLDTLLGGIASKKKIIMMFMLYDVVPWLPSVNFDAVRDPSESYSLVEHW